MLKKEIVKNKYIMLLGLGLLSDSTLLLGMQNAVVTGQAQIAIDKMKKKVKEQERIRNKHKKRLLEDANDNAVKSEIEEKGDLVGDLPQTIKNNVHLSKLERHTVGSYSHLKKTILLLDDEIGNIKKKLTDLNSKYEDFKKESNVDFNTILQSDFDNLSESLRDKYFSFIDTDEELRKELTNKVKLFEKKYAEYKKKAEGNVDLTIDDKIKKNIPFSEDDALRGDFLKRYKNYELKEKRKADVINKKSLLKEKYLK